MVALGKSYVSRYCKRLWNDMLIPNLDDDIENIKKTCYEDI